MSDYTKLLIKIRLENQLQQHKQYRERHESTRRHNMNIKSHNWMLEWNRLREATSPMTPALKTAYAKRMNNLYALVVDFKPELNQGSPKFLDPTRIT